MSETRARDLSDSLQEQGSTLPRAISTIHARVPTLPTPITRAVRLHERELLEQMPLTGMQCPRVGVEHRNGSAHSLRACASLI
jgi:hypothetical protein